MSDQAELDFDGTDPEQQLRRHWAENARKEREFWTKERLCLAWMQEHQPDDSDMRWFEAQPKYRQRYYLTLFDGANSEARVMGRPRTPFHLYCAIAEESAEIMAREDESLTERFLGYIREDFKAGRGLSISLENVTPGQRWRSQKCLDEAIRRAGIPLTSLGFTALP